eukprot:6484645-Pyramimonas_sp.AAC.1
MLRREREAPPGPSPSGLAGGGEIDMARLLPTNDRMLRLVSGGIIPAARPAVAPETDLTHQT